MKKKSFLNYSNLILKNLIPPIITKLILLIKNKYFFTPEFTYSGKFQSLNEAYKKTNQNSYYLNDEYDSKIAETTCKQLSEYKFLDDFVSNESQGCHERKGFLLLLCMSFCENSKKALNVIDYGGATNPQYINLTKEKRIKNNFFIIDRENLITKIQRFLTDNKILIPKNIFFYSDKNYMEKLNNHAIDIVFFGSCIQYIDHLNDLLYNFSKSGCKYFLFSDSVFTNFSNDFYVLQNNMKNTTFPNKWHSKILFDNFMNKLGYRLIANWKIFSKNKHDFLEKTSFDHQTLIYRKIN